MKLNLLHRSSIPGEEFVTSAAIFATSIAVRTPVPTPTPNIIDRVAEDIVTQTGLTEATFLGLTAEDWIDIFFSIILIGIGLLVLIPLLSKVVIWLITRTNTQFDNDFF